MNSRRTIIMALGLAEAITLTMLWTAQVGAFPTYRNTSSPGTDDCFQCHGDFPSSPYISPKGDNWGTSLHDGHRTSMLGPDSARCNICHSGSSRTPVYLNQSIGTTGFNPISCVGCHGRVGDRGVRPADCADAAATSGPCGDGAGLRQHHTNAGETVCQGCHNDATPTGFTPVGENVKPPYYFTPDVLHPTKPTDPCNPPPAFPENYKGSTLGLDNDGDLSYDMADTDCAAAPTATPVRTQTPVRTATPIATRTPTPVASPTVTRTPAATVTPTATRTVGPTVAPTTTPAPTVTSTAAASPTAAVTATAAPTATPRATGTPRPTPTPGRKILICHEHEKTILVSGKVLWTHLAHGDTIGRCRHDHHGDHDSHSERD